MKGKSLMIVIAVISSFVSCESLPELLDKLDPQKEKHPREENTPSGESAEKKQDIPQDEQNKETNEEGMQDGIQPFSMTSLNFAEGEDISLSYAFNMYGCPGNNDFPSLLWSHVPNGAKSFFLIVDDIDARGFVHLNLYNISLNVNSIPELTSVGNPAKVTFPNGTIGPNHFDEAGWGGPCPPGKHTYNFTIYALNVELLDFRPNRVSNSQFQAEQSSIILDSATLSGTVEIIE